MTYLPCRRVAHVEVSVPEPAAYVARVPDGQPVVLHGPAALIWQAVIQEPSPDAAAVLRRVSARAGVPAGEIQDDVDSFLARLVEDGYLEVV